MLVFWVSWGSRNLKYVRSVLCVTVWLFELSDPSMSSAWELRLRKLKLLLDISSSERHWSPRVQPLSDSLTYSNISDPKEPYTDIFSTLPDGQIKDASFLRDKSRLERRILFAIVVWFAYFPSPRNSLQSTISIGVLLLPVLASQER